MKKPASIAAITAMFAGLALFPVGSAHAQAGDLVCVDNGTANFSPALFPGGTSSVSGFDISLTNCASPNGRFSQFHTGRYEIDSGTITAAPAPNPCSLVFTASVYVEIYWDDGVVSPAHATSNTNLSNGTVTMSLYYYDPSDPLYGDTANFVGAFTPNADCATNGLQSLTATNSTEVFG